MRKLRSTLLLCALLSSCCHLAHAQFGPDLSRNLFKALDARGIPQTLRGKDLTSAWCTLSAGTSSEQAQFLQLLTDGRGSPKTDAPLYTRGDVINMGGESYLVAYSVEPERDAAKLRRAQQRAQMRASRGEMPDTRVDENATLVLSLLNLKTSGSLTDFRAFDPSRDILTDAAKAKNKIIEDREDSQSNLKQVALGVMQYVQDYDEMLPPMRAAQSVAQVRAYGRDNDWRAFREDTPVYIRLLPYVKSTDIFFQPATGRPYLPNWRISRMNEAQIVNPAQTILFYEDAPDIEGQRNVAFEDGHVEAVDEEKWKRMAKSAKLPP